MPRWLRLRLPDPIVAIAGSLGGVSSLVRFEATLGALTLASGALVPDLSSAPVPLLLRVPRDLSMELLIELTAFCVAEKTEEKKPAPVGCTREPPGVFASSIAGVNGLIIPPGTPEAVFSRRTVADCGEEDRELMDSLEVPTGFLALVALTDAGLAVAGLAKTGVGGVTNVAGVSVEGGVMAIA